MNKLKALTRYYQKLVDYEMGPDRKIAFDNWKKDLERMGIKPPPHKDAVKKHPETKTEYPPGHDAHGGYSHALSDADKDKAFDNK